jgi:predicted amidohydrolase
MLGKPKTLDVVTLQLSTHLRYQENLDRLLSYLDTYSNKHIVVVPEVFLTGLDYAHLATAAKFSANALKTLKKEVDAQIVVLTLILEDGEDFVNQAVVIHKHKIIHKQDKVKLFKLGDEDLYFRAGKKKKIKPFVINGVKYALLVCFELRFKELWKQVEGAEVVLVSARWGKPRKRHLEILSRALAVMNQCYVLLSNASGVDMASASAIISPTGDAIDGDKLEAIEGTIDFREIKKMRRYIAMDE